LAKHPRPNSLCKDRQTIRFLFFPYHETHRSLGLDTLGFAFVFGREG
jgi:hypothetical protein